MESRECFNLFTKMGRRHFFRCGILGSRWARKYVLKDTFGRFICRLFGHSNYFTTSDNSRVCKRCYKRV